MDYSLITNEPLDYCVYVHINKINGELYIGITNDLNTRWRSNGAAYKGCSHFENAIDYYGWDNFYHIVLIDGIPRSMAGEIEKQLIKKYNTIKNGYNIKDGGVYGGSYGSNHPKSKPIYQYDLDGNFIKKWDAPIFAEKFYGVKDITRAANGLLKSTVGYQWSYIYYEKMESYYHPKPIYQYTIEGDFIKEWEDVHDAVNTYNLSIKSCASGVYRTSNNYRWSYEKIDKLPPLEPIQYSKKKGYIFINGRYQKKYPRVFQYDLNHNLINIYENIQELTDDIKKLDYLKQLCRKNIQMVHNDSVWIFEDLIDDEYIDYVIEKHNKKFKHINQYDLDGNYVATYKSLSEIEQLLGFNHGSISNVCKGVNKTAYNYQWRYCGDDAPKAITHNKCDDIPVIQKSLDGEIIAKYNSASAASGVIHNTTTYSGKDILDVCRGTRKTAYGYLWEFAS